MNQPFELVPLLVVRGARKAIDFYVRALGASVLTRFEHGPERHTSHAELAVGAFRFAVTEEVRAFHGDAPVTLGGSAVILQLAVANAERALDAMKQEGATVVFPVQDLLGERMARVRDPFGHVWLLRQRVTALATEEIQRQRDELFDRFAALEDRSSLSEHGGLEQAPRIHLVLGPVGAGKSTFALALARERRAVRFTLDRWMTELFGPDRPESGVVEWYVERAKRCCDRIWSVAKSLLELGTPVILELGLLKRRERELFYRRFAEAGFPVTIHVLDAAREVRRERVLSRNRERGDTFAMHVPLEIFELASDHWEPLDAEECHARDVCFIRID